MRKCQFCNEKIQARMQRIIFGIQLNKFLDQKIWDHLTTYFCSLECFYKYNKKMNELREMKKKLINRCFNQNKNGYVYFFKLKNKSIIKIGLSKNSSNRKKQLETKLPWELELINEFLTSSPYFLEKELHSIYCNQRMNGEWFNLPPEEIRQLSNLNKNQLIDKITHNKIKRSN